MKLLQSSECFFGGPQAQISDPLQTLSSQQHRSLAQELSSLADQCPDYSFIELKFSINQYAQVMAQLTINSLKLQFDQQCTCSNAVEGWRELKEQAQQKITEWKAQRFAMPLPQGTHWEPPIAS